MSERMVAFLRGMNVGGHRVKNPELEAIFTDLGLDDATGYLASGNVVFDTDTAPTAPKIAGLELRIATALERTLGYGVPTMIRTAEQVRSIASTEPFDETARAGFEGKLQTLLVRDEPDADTASELLALATDDDLLHLDGRTLFWLPRGGLLESALELTALDRIVGVATMRTANTMQRLTKKFLG